MKTVTQSLAAAVQAFKDEFYKNTAYEPKRLEVWLDDAPFESVALNARVDGDRVQVTLLGVDVVVRRHSTRYVARQAVDGMKAVR